MSTVIIGLSLSFLLFLLAAGLTLIFGMLRIINFAHGALYMLGAYLGFQFIESTGSFWLALILTPFLVAAIGTLGEVVFLRRVYDRDHVYQLLLTFGFVLVIEEATRLIWGLDYKQVSPPDLLSEPVLILGSLISSYRLFIILFGAAVSVAMFLVIDRSRFGMIVRAASSDPDMVDTLGINVSLVRMLVFTIGCGLAGLGGVIAAPMVPVELGMGTFVILDCFIVVIVGGLGNIRGAVLASLMLGMTRAVGFTFAPDWVDILTFVLLIATLLTRPQGLFSTKGRLA